MVEEVGAFDAKAKLSELLRSVREGRRYTITVRGEPVAEAMAGRPKGCTEKPSRG
ncbi:MAG: type II toxin-antitoxin system prevent-host-death family antitoxin [Gammaproteobacteria bacterium]|nr:type II toxin-antitoxin system prevent-host-death family antitoxin [Gammaproteobacteria bacterium]MBU1653913.1 type II toxin-antitoxin system prevent-host-death family antitoxin [Gammaproteobacteria bacterium]MBU1960910.1 type II toxin-antitoxin system prevent-host-death family antitoxin [Gammaproteobacteria bacterium]